MKSRTKVELIPEDKIKFTQNQKNLIELAFDKQIPPEDAQFIEKIQKNSRQGKDPFVALSEYFTTKYGQDFGIIYLSAIIGGKEKYKETVKFLEKLKAIERSKQN